MCEGGSKRWPTTRRNSRIIESIKARGWWPLSRSSTKIFFWRFVFFLVYLALLNPIERFSWRVCVVQATKKEEESCSFLDAIGRRSCGPLSRLTKNRQVGNPSFDSSGSRQLVGMVRYGTLWHSPLTWHALQLTFESLLSLLCMHVVGHATESEVHASGKFCSISDPSPPPPPLSLSLSVSPCDQIREKESLPLNTTIRTSKRKFAKCGHQVQVSHS